MEKHVAQKPTCLEVKELYNSHMYGLVCFCTPVELTPLHTGRQADRLGTSMLNWFCS